MSSSNWPPTSSGGVPIYATFASFPAGVNHGDLAVAADTQALYAWNGSSWQLEASPTDVLTGIGTIDTGTPSANGAQFLSTQLIMQSATGSLPGLVNTTTQTFAGAKTFTGAISASNLSGTNSGNVTIGTANGLSLSSQQISLGTASGSTTGALTSADWTTFNNKQATITTGNLTDAGTDGITVTNGTGAVIGTGTSLAQHVADTTHNGYLSSTDWNTFNGKQAALTIGNLTDVGTDGITVTGGTGAVIGTGTSLSQHVADTTHNGYLSSTDWNTFNGKQAAGSYITALTGDVAATGPGSVGATLATVNSNVGSFTHASITVNGKGLVTAASSGTLPGSLYASVYYPYNSTNFWSNANTSIGDYTVNGTIPSPSTYVNAGFGTISKATSSLPGINFSAPRTGTLRLTVTLATIATASDFVVITLVESTTSTTLGSAGITFVSGASSGGGSTIVGYFPTTASTTYNFKLQSQTNAGTNQITGGGAATGSQLTFAMEYIS